MLAASYLFYSAASIGNLLILVGVTAATYLGARFIAIHRNRLYLGLLIAAVLSPLAFFKYRAFALTLLGGGGMVSGLLWSNVLAALPVGLSFYTFQAISYMIDVFRGRSAAIRDYRLFSLYLAFFPQLVAGPIERVGHLAPQLMRLGPVTAENVYIGLKTALWGYFCKLVIADKLGSVVEEVLARNATGSSLSLVLCLYLYSFRIYFDFYGYTSIAIGIARTLGVQLSQNFRHPYLAQSIQEFWRRWHITLMTWFRDYLYIPLGGAERGPLRQYASIALVFLVSGLWHGATLTFVLWGLIHATFYLVGRTTAPLRARLASTVRLNSTHPLPSVLRGFTCFTLVSLAWLPFILTDTHALWQVVSRVVGSSGARSLSLDPALLRSDTLFFVAVLLVFFALDSLGAVRAVVERVPSSRREIARELFLVNVMAVSVFLLGDLGNRAFIYFQF